MALRLIFLPSLKHVAIAKLALTIYNSSLINVLVDELQELEEICSDPRCDRHQQRVQEKWVIIEHRVQKKFHRKIPASLLKKVIGALRAIHAEVNKWKEDHKEFLNSSDKEYVRTLVWNSDGTVNRTKTAEVWIKNESLELCKRFYLACIYFSENDVMNLWEEMTFDDQRKFMMESSNLAVNFWIDWLINLATGQKSYDEILNKNFNPQHFWNSSFRIRLSCIFQKMTPLAKQGCFWHHDWFKKIHHDDLLICFNQMDKSEQVEMIRLYPREVFQLLLDWPLQGAFSEMAEQMIHGMDSSTFNGVTTYVLFNKIRAGWKDADYVKMIHDFWNYCSPLQQSNVKQTQEFDSLRVVLNYSKRQPFTIEETLGAVMYYRIKDCHISTEF